jgi:hypothetical protein
MYRLFLYLAERTTVRHYARSVGTLPNKGNNNGTVLQGAFKRESHDCHTSGGLDPPFSWEMPVPSRENDSCFLVSHLVMS